MITSTQVVLTSKGYFYERGDKSIILLAIMLLATFRLEYENDYEYEFSVLSTRTSKIFALQA